MRKKTYYGDPPAKRRRTLKEITGLNGWDIFKGGTGIIAGGCASAMAHRYLAAAVPAGHNFAEKVVIGVGVYFVTGLIGHTVEQYVMGELDDLRNSLTLAQQISSEKEKGGDDANNG